MEIKLSDIQKITLRDILTTTGLSERQVEDIFLLLSFKPEHVQLAFYYRACGKTYFDISSILHRTVSTIEYYIKVSCDDINEYLSDI